MWLDKNNSLQKEFQFQDYQSALAFVNRISIEIEKIGHHPTITLSWGLVVIITTTHDQGNTVTEKDHELTRLIDVIYE